MHIKSTLCGIMLSCFVWCGVLAQTTAREDGDAVDKAISFPSLLLGKLQKKTADMDQQLTKQTEKYLEKMQRREEKMRKKLWKVDSNAAKQLFAGSAEKYAALEQKIKTDTGNVKSGLNGTYLPYADSLRGALGFLQTNPGMVSEAGTASGAAGLASGATAKVQGAVSQMQALQAKMGDADVAKAFVQQRKQEISNYISQHASLQNLLGKEFTGLNQEVYYYTQQLREYKEMWNHPDQLEQKALGLLNKLPAFQTFMSQNSQLASLFRLPGNYGTPQALAGLQTRDQVNQLIQNQVAAGGPGAADMVQSNLQAAQGQLDSYKDKLSSLGQGGGDVDMPNFKPNDQKTKTFLKRLEYGVNIQTTHGNYYFPTVTDFGLSLGYKLGHSNIIGVGASYKLGWGSGFNHIAISSQGAGLRSFLEIKIKTTFSATGGFEYNYNTPFNSFQDIKAIDRWTKSGLIGITKTMPAKGRFFKKTKLQLLWDFLSYQAVPKTQPILFRIGYNF